MAQNLHVPIRMCVQCRTRMEQRNLIRLQCKVNRVQTFDGKGRSLYVCASCLENPKLAKHLAGRCKCTKESQEEISSLLKELIIDVR